MTTYNLTDTQVDCLADIVGHLITLARQQKAAASRVSEASNAAAHTTEQTEAARQTNCNTTGRGGQGE